MRGGLGWLLAALVLLFAAAPALAQEDPTARGLAGAALVRIPIGIMEVGQVVKPPPGVPTTGVCQWYRSASAISGATSCVSYTVQTADIGNTLYFWPGGRAVVAALGISGTPASTGTVGTAYSFTPGTSGGAGSNVFSLTGTLATGMTFTAGTGHIGGTPTAAGAFAGLDVTVTDAYGATASLASFTITIASGCTTGKLDFSCAANSDLIPVIR